MSEFQTGQSAGSGTLAAPGRWASRLDRLHVPPLPKEAVRFGVEGRRPTGPVKGFGPLWRRTYSIRLAGADVTPAEVIRVWRERFGSFWQAGNYAYGADRPIEAGDVLVLNLAGPAGLVIATGVYVVYAGEDSFCFLSSEGHMFGGLITFSAYQESEPGGATVAQVEALLRASDPVWELMRRLGLVTREEDRFWHSTLTRLGAHFGVPRATTGLQEGQLVSQTAVLLDRRLQWSQVGNLLYNGGAWAALYLPVRILRRFVARRPSGPVSRDP